MIRVLVVDDSALVRKVLIEHLKAFPDIDVVGAAVDPYNARDMLIRLRPDVITLDIEMPRMDGLSFLQKLMKHYPTPVVVVSSLTPRNSETAIRALELGAVEVICKPGGSFSTGDIGRQLVQAIRAAAGARGRLAALAAPTSPQRPAANAGTFQLSTTQKVLALGASTGGTAALETVLGALPADTPGTIVVQHMPENFTAAFARRLDSLCSLEVREARDLDQVLRGVVLIAPGGRHMILQRSGATYQVRLKDGPVVHFQKPSVDVLFHSVAEAAGRNAVGAILTGMGSDGAAGLLGMKQRGARTFAQDERSCVVYGMPREAVRVGAVDEIVPLQEMARALLTALRAKAEAA
mgnify:CR=1 FL=1